MKHIFILLLLPVVLLTSPAIAQEPVTKMQSLYIYNFIKNIRWRNVDTKYIVGVYGDEKRANEINTIIGIRKFAGKDIEVKTVKSPTEAASCHIVFVPAAYKGMVKKLAIPSVAKNTLIVSEEGGIESGASIAFLIDNSKLKFKVNEQVCKTSGLLISATLLSLSQ